MKVHVNVVNSGLQAPARMKYLHVFQLINTTRRTLTLAVSEDSCDVEAFLQPVSDYYDGASLQSIRRMP